MVVTGPLRMYTILVQILLCQVNAVYFESIRASNILGSHFGYPGQSATFDYVVVGGGTAGLTVARRLAENGSFTVAVIEAGNFIEFGDSNRSAVPYYALAGGFSPSPLADWQQKTTPQSGLLNRTIAYTRGKVLGGSSTLNAQGYQRGSAQSYDKWATTVGDSTYKWGNFIDFFKQSITFTSQKAKYIPANTTVGHNISASGSHGPLQVSYPRWINPSTSWFFKAAKKLGASQASGFLDGKLLGYDYVALSLDPASQTRSTSETGSLRRALLDYPNVIVYQSTLATKILFDNQKTAVAVSVNSGGVIGVDYQINATREIILSAGAFRTPQVLQLSGIGDPALLSPLGIPVLSNLPGVGKGLEDNLIFGLSYPINLPTHNTLNDPSIYATALSEYLTNRTGILTNTGGEALWFEHFTSPRISNATAADLAAIYPSDWPTVEIAPQDGSLGPPTTANTYSQAVAVLQTFSRGEVYINSTSATINPIVNMNYLSDPRDREIAIAAFKRVREVVKAMGPIITGPELAPGAAVTTDEEILQYIQETAGILYHACCGARQGRVEDKSAVTDSKGRVFGVKGLRIVDVSAFPFLPPGQPQATVYALAEKIAAAILDEE